VANFTKLAATALRLINANGRTVTIVHQGNTPTDPTKPWRGEDTTVRASVTGTGVFTSLEALNPDNTKREGQMLLFAASADESNDLEEFDQVVDGARYWKIVRAEVIGPADTRVLYKFEVSR
jgi:hypothetical protein